MFKSRAKIIFHRRRTFCGMAFQTCKSENMTEDRDREYDNGSEGLPGSPLMLGSDWQIRTLNAGRVICQSPVSLSAE